MRKVAVVAATMLVALTGATVGALARGIKGEAIAPGGDLSLELVGQVTNTPLGVTPATSSQYGYLSYLRGLQVFEAEPENETDALFTFYVQATTTRVLSDGPLRVLTRVGKLTIYHDPSANGSFDKPDTFRDGAPILVAGLRQQVVIDTVTGAFTTHNLNQITSTTGFRSGSRELHLGRVGQKFETVLSGHQNMPPPPSGYFAGYTFGRT